MFSHTDFQKNMDQERLMSHDREQRTRSGRRLTVRRAELNLNALRRFTTALVHRFKGFLGPKVEPEVLWLLLVTQLVEHRCMQHAFLTKRKRHLSIRGG